MWGLFLGLVVEVVGCFWDWLLFEVWGLFLGLVIVGVGVEVSVGVNILITCRSIRSGYRSFNAMVIG